MTEITIATSIAPKNLETQRAAINSWLNLGFKVISLNTFEECSFLAPEFPGIRFEVASRTALDFAGKPYVFFDDMLEVLRKQGSPICGIINSDIYLQPNPAFFDKVLEIAAIDFLFASRVEVSTLAADDGLFYPYGFDLFFFPSNFLAHYPASDFCIGVPWWDYWALLVPIAKNLNVREYVAPVAFHVAHDSRWDVNLHESFCNHLFQCATKGNLFTGSAEALLKELQPAYESKNSFLISLIYLRYFHNHVVSVQAENVSALECCLTRQYLVTRNELLEDKIRIYKLHDELAAVHSILANIK